MSSVPRPAPVEFFAGKGEDAQERLFHFETLLKAIERFFNPANHPLRTRRGSSFDDGYGEEMLVVERQLNRALKLTQTLLNENDSNALTFQSYVENQWVTDEARDALLQKHFAQEAPRDSLFLLQEGLQSLYHLARGLRTSGQVNALRFDALGRQYRSLVASNRHFSPFRTRRFMLVTPSHRRPFVRRAVQAVVSPRLRRAMLLMIAILERYLSIVAWINPKAVKREELLDALPFLALLKSEFRVLQGFLEEAFMTRWLPGGPANEREEEFRSRVDSLAFELGADLHRVFDEFLLDFFGSRSVRRMRGALEAAHGLLTVFLEQAMTSILTFGTSELGVRQVFPDAEIRLQESKRLREDLWMFSEVLDHVTDRIRNETVSAEQKKQGYKGLLDYLTYFENLGFQLVRHTDREAFEHFFGEMRALRDELFTDSFRCGDVAVNFETFKIYIQAVHSQVNLRSDLREIPFDLERARKALQQFTYDLKS
jgi:hypothetical protein